MKNLNTLRVTTLATALVAVLAMSQSVSAFENHEEGEVKTNAEHKHMSMKNINEFTNASSKEVGGGDTSHAHKVNYSLEQNINNEIFPDYES